MKKVVSIFLAVVGGFAGSAIYNNYYKSSEKPVISAELKRPVHTVNYNGANYEANVNFETAAEKTVHAVVHIKTYFRENSFMTDPWHQFFFGDNGYRRNAPQQVSTGSGVIISDNGYIATNNHVIANAEKIEVTLNNNKTYQAEVVGRDPNTDLALLKIDEKNLPYITYGNSDDVKVGQWALAVGNPFNLTSTVTAGIISAKGRSINILEANASKDRYPIESFIQTDAAVNPGNSGGALVNTAGELIGINSAIASNTGSYAGYSFAVPVNIVKKVMSDLLEFGAVQRAFIGVSIREIDTKLAEEKKLNQYQGIYVAGITEGGAADQAGIKEGDIITQIGGTAVNSSPELQEQVGKYRPGDKIDITLIRNGKEKLLSLVLKNKNNNTDLMKREKSSVIKALGAEFEPVTADEMQRLRIVNGLKVKKLGQGKLAGSGIKEGFIITSIDKKPVTEVEDLSFLESKKGGVLIEGVYPNGFRAYYGFGL
ncbi:MAG: Do family serine endopeptidase [Bacteroidia bacterium]|nr:Do family serine endopeptidase [Bacteroidia bacterium]MCZ2248403.1 Do family serine endopeptidase [Bacteroidia bacterium]